VLYEAYSSVMQRVVHRVEKVKEQAAQELKQLRWQLMVVNAQKEPAVLENTQSMKNLIK